MYTFDNKSLIKDNKRWFPLMGEIHFSRYPKQYWKESLNKMKAGGIDIVSSYVIWIHHEEIQGEYDFSGNKDLRAFVEACKECNMKLLLRIGPWCHGEVRNGGFPDWLLHQGFECRTNDKAYLAQVKKWYKKIYKQVKGLLYSEKNIDNPIIGVQIENEFGHCGGLYDESGELHMQLLYKMAVKTGFKVPLYTATGWGGAKTGGLLPVMGGYCDAPWDQRTTKIEPSGNYVFTYERNDHNIGSDHGLGYGITFDQTKFPYLTAELGGGLQVTKHRRTIATSKDIGAMSMVKLGSGVNLLGYYMYHGGSNPDGKLTSLQETRETGYPNDLPEKSYDFRAPVREYGQVSETFREIKILSYFVHDFGSELCDLPAVIPQDNPLDPANLEELRYSFRTDGKKGYLFINNYVRLETLAEHKSVELKTPEGQLFPPMDIASGQYFFVPYNMKYNQTEVKTSLATVLCKLEDGTVVFYSPEGYENKGEFFQFGAKENNPKLLVISRQDALNSWKNSKNHLVITDQVLLTDENNQDYILARTDKSELKIYSYPELAESPEGFVKGETVNKNLCSQTAAYNFVTYTKTLPKNPEVIIGIQKGAENTYSLNLQGLVAEYAKLKLMNNYNDCFVQINYKGESARLYKKTNEGKKLIADNFFLGEDYTWEIGLKQFIDSGIDFSDLELEILPFTEEQPVYIEKELEDKTPELKGISYNFEVKVHL